MSLSRLTHFCNKFVLDHTFYHNFSISISATKTPRYVNGGPNRKVLDYYHFMSIPPKKISMTLDHIIYLKKGTVRESKPLAEFCFKIRITQVWII